ncbi:MAG: ferredoxin [Nanoarchaeota archaeon]|nr:ferredoxin [Nanoarchaeota archaeon]MBU4300923.1 ferredoxin [Nanoarchaeota archaeon]MBU4451532.1 ferredoxin [Nanoarchaeota archaeon]MCG2723269.1 ferredoxin [archaeon]
MALKIDANLCIGCGLCITICPDAFELKDDGKAHVVNENGCKKCNCDEAIEKCPVIAISR